ncbi:hypothetical protein HYPSUDRAFT_90870 [Hypholoma sublateritium FD-334 SS-4]|uniref:Uncharacterized protein n=1 Tax=Hypholoma sublateritium (strain FD-334 SS-4) TaxID=945553 RepID=A0A0D2KRH0_HYPSF|nr:hypothetical protein HYPSUDRAFT_90870 [Hypholoma sublateritium FD-334 SS-4]
MGQPRELEHTLATLPTRKVWLPPALEARKSIYSHLLLPPKGRLEPSSSYMPPLMSKSTTPQTSSSKVQTPRCSSTHVALCTTPTCISRITLPRPHTGLPRRPITTPPEYTAKNQIGKGLWATTLRWRRRASVGMRMLPWPASMKYMQLATQVVWHN